MLPFDPRKPLFGFKARAPHARRRIHLFADKTGVFFRPRTAPADWWGGFADERITRRAIRRKWWARVVAGLSQPIAKSHFYRVFDVSAPDASGRTWRIWWRPDESWLEPLDQKHGQLGAFLRPRPSQFHLWRTPTATLKEHFLKEWADAGSDARDAMGWCDLNMEERQSRALRWAEGDLATLRQLLEAAMKAAVWDEPPKSTRSLSAVWLHKRAMQLDITWQSSPAFQTLLPPLVPVIEARFRSFYDLPDKARLNWGFPWFQEDVHCNFDVCLQVAEPTAHERLEAALFLREWLRQNAPDLLPDWFPGDVG